MSKCRAQHLSGQFICFWLGFAHRSCQKPAIAKKWSRGHSVAHSLNHPQNKVKHHTAVRANLPANVEVHPASARAANRNDSRQVAWPLTELKQQRGPCP